MITSQKNRLLRANIGYFFFFLTCLHAKHMLLPFDLSTNLILLHFEHLPIMSFIIFYHRTS